MDTLRKNQRKSLELKNKVIEMINTFDGLISRLDKAKERISELENMLIMFSIIIMQRKWNDIKKNIRISKSSGTYQKSSSRVLEHQMRKKITDIFEVIMAEHLNY